jgi:hypothetical protein
MTTPQNPFEVLRLSPATGPEEVVRQAGRLRQRAGDESAVAAIRQAVGALTGAAEERVLHGLLTHPGPCYNWPALDRFVAAFRRLPPPATAAEAGKPLLDLADIAALLGPLSAGEGQTPPPAEEVERQAIAALWRCLLAEPLA